MNLVYVNTAYQLEVFLDVVKFEKLPDYIVIAPDRLKSFVTNEGLDLKDFRFYCIAEERRTLRQSRCVIKIVKKIAAEFADQEIDFWLANDDRPVAQILSRIIDIKRVRLFEDGLGSYMQHRFMLHDRGIINLLARIKSIIYFFPYYRAVYLFGANFKANKCYSYHEQCFPHQKMANKVIVDKQVNKREISSYLEDMSVIFVGQPLIEQNIVSEADYLRIISKVCAEIVDGRKIYYKPHPLEKDKSKVLKKMQAIHDNVTLEALLASSNSRHVVIGFYSTALANVVPFPSVVNVTVIRSKCIKVSRQIYVILDKIGCNVIDINL